MDLSGLQIFRTVVREGGVTRAAERLNRVQSNVTTRVRQLEEDLGVELFIREGKRLHLSPAGQVLIDYADRLLELADEARDAVQDSKPRGIFRLGSMESTAAVRLPAVLSEYQRRYPDVKLELRTGNPEQLATAILAGEVDAAFAADPVAEAPFEKVLAFEEPLVIVAPEREPLTGSDGDAARTIVTFEVGCPHRKRLEDWFASQHDMPGRTIEMTSYHTILGCVVAGMGISLVPRSVLKTFPDRKRLSLHDLPPGRDVANTVLFWRKGVDSPKINGLIDIMNRSEGDKKGSRRTRASAG